MRKQPVALARKALLRFALLVTAVVVGVTVRRTIIYVSHRMAAAPASRGHFDTLANIVGVGRTCRIVEQTETEIADAARMFYAATGTIPTSQMVLVQGGYLSSGRLDAFATTGPAQFQFRIANRHLYIWSVGPDGRDDSGDVAYDPTNGLNSCGDIVTSIPLGPP
jgi:hypothetical protein